MAGIRLEWAQFGDFDSFDVLRSDIPMDIGALPTPIVVNLRTMYYADTALTLGNMYYYRVVAHRGDVSMVSDEVRVQAFSDDYWNNVVALLHFDANYIDASSKGSYISFGNVSYVAGRFDKAIELLPASSSSANGLLENAASNPNLALETGDFTIELFVKPLAGYKQNDQVLLSLFDTHPHAGWQLLLTGLKPAIYRYDSGGSTFLTSSTALTIGEWYHIAICRVSGVVTIFVNGAVMGSAANASNYKTTDIKLSVGYQAYGLARYPFTGVIDELRITKGVARYTAKFTPPDKPFVSI